MKKTYDLRLTTSGRVVAMRTGLFEDTHGMVYGNSSPFPSEEYTTVELPLCFYRLRKKDLENPRFVKFLERARAHQDKQKEKAQ